MQATGVKKKIGARRASLILPTRRKMIVFFCFVYPGTFLGGKKSTKRTAPRSLATPQAWLPSREEFFGAKMNSPRFQRGSDSIFAFPEKFTRARLHCNGRVPSLWRRAGLTTSRFVVCP
ncbi:hypothetical protein [Desulfosudis oleivorans]|uniref:hypothetical protein n=1 Tax=Desulfosudis oleivorans TaxID=181663 RepID=UPI001294830B|nr:hypothetical protein [Desulfosudis oleivorans]